MTTVHPCPRKHGSTLDLDHKPIAINLELLKGDSWFVVVNSKESVGCHPIRGIRILITDDFEIGHCLYSKELAKISC